MTIKTFMPNGADTATLAVTTTTARVAIDQYSSNVRVVNDGANTAFIAFGDVTVASTTSRMPIRSGATEVFTKGAYGFVAALTATGTTNLYFTSGEGL
jgi:hypothetical protein